MRTLVVGWCVIVLLDATGPICSAGEGDTQVRFKKIQLDSAFRSHGVAVGDFNGDGKLDVSPGGVYYAAPDWKMHPIVENPTAFDPQKGVSDTYLCFAGDVNRDGRTDLITCSRPGGSVWWFENPAIGGGAWKKHLAVSVFTTESPTWAEVRGDGRKDLVLGYPVDQDTHLSPKKRMAFARPGEAPDAIWSVRTFSALGGAGTRRWDHGLGVGDVNSDGRLDVVVRTGWYEAPADVEQPEWTFHRADLGEDCAQMLVHDFDGDGDNDVLSTSAHAFGIWCHEQTPDGWQTHEIDKSISQTHAVCLADLNGDGLADFVTGKRWWAHGGRDPGADMPAVLVWFELSRQQGRPVWTKHLIDDDSGVGTQFEVTDVNGDGLLDIVTSAKKGVFYFEQTRQ